MKVVDKRFTFMESYYLSIKKISDDLKRLKFYESIVQYGLYQEEMDFDDDLEKAYFEELKAHIDISNYQREINRENGAKGGAPKGNSNASKNKPKQPKTTENKPIKKNTIQSNGIQSNGIQSKSYKEKLYSELPSELVNALEDFESMRKQIKKPITDKARETILKKLHEYSNGDLDIMIDILNQSIVNCWSSVYPLQEIKNNRNGNQSKGLSSIDMLKMYEGKE